jgi:hypothetical protein
MTVTRRQLSFNTLDEVIADVERLQAKGYTATGQWDLSQVCRHLAEWLRFPVQGFPRMNPVLGLVFWVLRNTIGRRSFRKFLDGKPFPAGKPTMPQTVFPAGGNATEAVALLQQSIDGFKNHRGPVQPSPLFGAMTYDDAVRMQLLHCAHHLSFLVPNE